MSIFGSWIATLVFFFVVFLVGILLQYKEKRERLTKRAQEALRREFATGTAVGASGASTYGTVYGSPTQYERRRAVR